MAPAPQSGPGGRDLESLEPRTLLAAASPLLHPIPQLTDDRHGAIMMDARASAKAAPRSDTDATLSVDSASFEYNAARQSLLFHFSGDVSASLDVGDLALTSGSDVPASAISVSFDGATNTATFQFPGYANGILPDGNYRATLRAAGISDSAGGTLAADYSFDFFFFQGDLNHDRAVDVVDLGMLSASWQQDGTYVQGDLNYDGRVDVVDLGILSSKWQEGLPAPANRATYSVGASPDFVVSADFNGDGRADLASSSYAGGRISILLGNGDGTFQQPAAISLPVSSPPDHLTAGDLNGDGNADLLVTSFNADAVLVLLGRGDGTFTDPASYAAGSGPRAAVLGDFTGDGRLDIAVAKSYDAALTVLRNNGDGTFAAPSDTALGLTPSDLVAGDFNGDGKLDLAAADYFADRVAILLGDGSGAFQPQPTAATGMGPTSIASADLSGDGKLDLVTADYLDDSVSVLAGNGDGTLRPASALALPAGDSGPTFIAAADLDSDGSADLVCANASSDSVTVFAGHGDGTFAAGSSSAAGASPRSLVLGDFNGGTMDIAIADQGGSTITVLLEI